MAPDHLDMAPRPKLPPVRSYPAPRFAGSIISLLRLDQEHRRHYRVPQMAGPKLLAVIPFTDGSSRAGTCLDVSIGGAGIHFTLEQDPDLERGDEVVLVFQVADQPATLRVVGRVLFRLHTGPSGVRYAFVFPRSEEMRSIVTGWWGRWFNRRKFKRFVPGGNMAIPAELRWAKGQISGRVADISLGGLALEYNRDSALSLRGVRALHVSLHLPEEEMELRFRVTLKSSFVGTRDVRVGLEFVMDKAFEQAAPRLQRWIERHMVRAQSMLPPPRG